ncbi:pyridoxal phosphate-dependent aminotransferase [Weissella tructae]|uniref:Aminotransferase n=2 Tax=Weissella TaxID=46255 RepID=A0A075U0R1_9LACO|nr:MULTISPECIES: aminotransferase class I/II-fold pyridoxal phosphate-dependent enzyme [Weissella]AIG65778.1 PatA_2 protein [Weissella tructae]AIM63157.1 PatA_2 protein [Weissella ceti]AIM64493.1 PatA_2 protein [Weissella ceti]ELA06769.1 putative aminotransferase A [Weissella ceti NC36]QVV90940.1 aminotransferase class I/II-fold pyridoxal phosphate-dependent enzyme [Weissella tructae]
MPTIKNDLYDQLNTQVIPQKSSALRAWHQKFQADESVIDLSLGEPGFAVSQEVKHAFQEAIASDASHYASTKGYVPLRERVAGYVTESFDAPAYSVAETLITVGATEGIYATFQALFSRGDAIIIPMPAYPLYGNIAALLGIEIIPLDTRTTDFKVTPEGLEDLLGKHANIKGFIFNDPTNPTGATYTAQEVSDLAQVLLPTNLVVVTDEIYGALTYDDAEHVTIAKYLPEQTILIGGLSKSHAMTGYRLGFVLGPELLMNMITQVHQLMVSSVNTPLMIAGVTALDNHENFAVMKRTYQMQRDLMVEALRALGFMVISPKGGFYVLAKLPASVVSEETFVSDLATQAKVGVLPGNIFGLPGYIRLSFAGNKADIEEAMDRMQQFLSTIA